MNMFLKAAWCQISSLRKTEKYLFHIWSRYLWWLICAMSYYRVFVAKIRQTGAKTQKVATQKPAKWWLFCVFAWRPFAPPFESTWHSMRCVFGYCLSCSCLARRKVAMRKPDKITLWRVCVATFCVFTPKTRLYDMA